MAELWMLYDGDKRPTGKTMVRGEPMPEGYWHIIVSIWTLTADGRLLLTQRSPNKKLALLWEGTAGSVVAGETSLQGALRELREETGLRAGPEELRLMSSTKTDRFFFDSYLYLCPERAPKLTLQTEEVSDACFVEVSEMEAWRPRLAPPAWDRFCRDRATIEAAAEECRNRHEPV